MTTSHNYGAEYYRIAERFDSAVTEENLAVSNLLTAGELLPRYGDAIASLSAEAYGRSDEQAQEWVIDCTQAIGFHAMVLTTQADQLVGFTWGTPVANDPGSDMDVASEFMAAQRQERDIPEGNELYSTALVIAPEYRGKGLGSGLALAAIKRGNQELYADGALLFYRTRRENRIAHRTGMMLGARITGIHTPEYERDLWMAYIPPATVGALK